VRRRWGRNVAVSTRDRNMGKTTTKANQPLLARMGRYASALPRIELESIKFLHLARVSTRHATPRNLRQLGAGSGGLERGLFNMAEDSSANRSEWAGDDRVGKSFIVMSTNGDLPTNPMSLRECVVCGGVFTRDESRDHSDARCQPSPGQPYAMVQRRG
jgi:hypothetical protein